MSGYAEYYQRTIDSAAQGIKLILGPTGLGKTSSISDVIRLNPGRKFIYMANRKQLLDEMASRFKPHEHVVLRRDLEVVQHLLRTQQDAFYTLLADARFTGALRRARQILSMKTLDVATIKRACTNVQQMTAQYPVLPDWFADQVDEQARIVLGGVRSALFVIRDQNEQSPAYRWLINHPVIETLFPAIAFRRRSDVTLMLMTLQKAYYGFFDGQGTRNLMDLSSGVPLIIFLDEFDFLEPDLVKLICRAPQIDEPFDFVRHFYQAMTQHKLPKADYPVSPPIRHRIERIIEIINGVQQRGITYPRCYQFTWQRDGTSGGSRLGTPAIFRTRHAVSTNPLYIHQTERAFQLESHRTDPAWVPASWFFNAVGTASTRILTLFKELQIRDEVRYHELLRQCFRNTVFIDQIEHIAQFPGRHQNQTSQRGTLLDGGYSLFDIDELGQRTDIEEVAVRHYQMLQTPESLLRALAATHLVFGLSATADLPRSVHHFDLNWLEEQGLLLPITEADRADIQHLSDEKAGKRNNHVTVTQIDGLTSDLPLHTHVATFLEAVTHTEEFGEDTRGGHRSLRMYRFWAAVLWLLEHPQGPNRQRMLLFLNTFRQVRHLFTTFARDAAEVGVYLTEPLPHMHTAWFDAVTVGIGAHRVRIVFFDAALGTQTRQNKEALDAFTKVFWCDEPVVVVTQYLSAGNGVNLQYTDREGGPRRDFTHIALMEAPYYFFATPNDDMGPDDVLAACKENIWYQAKLFAAKQISEARFRQVLATINHPNEWNTRYRQGSTATDWLFNQMAIYIQALGRIEREWELSPDQVALLAPEVFHAFQAFLGSEYEALRDRRLPFTSANLRAICEAIAEQTAQIEREARRRRDTRLRARNEQCRQSIGELVEHLEQVRQHGDIQARHDWEVLRLAVLEHDFHGKVVERYQCIATSPYLHHGKLNLIDRFDILPLDMTLPDSAIYDLNAVYGIIRENTVICEHFVERGFDLQFDHPGPEFFTPYCMQAILTGAIGEEAITALLTHAAIPVEPLPDAIFEVADLMVSGRPWFVDCKNYNELTLDRFALTEDDPLWHPTLNERHFAARAQSKLLRLSAHAGPDTKLIYLNLVTGQERPLGYYDAHFRSVNDFEDAHIIVIQGALDQTAPNRLHEPAQTLLADLHNHIHGTPSFPWEELT